VIFARVSETRARRVLPLKQPFIARAYVIEGNRDVVIA
jgi:hypothetical protein